MTQEQLAKWCGCLCNCYYYLFDGELYNTGECPMVELYEGLSFDVEHSPIFEDVTDQAEELHPQLQYEVEHNGCTLYKVFGKGVDIIICYFSLNFSD